MKSHSCKKHAEARSLCADLHPDDGQLSIPRRREQSYDANADLRKTMQLCAQVRRALYGVIPLPGSALSEDLLVESVEPDPDSVRLKVVISVPANATLPIPALRIHLKAKLGYIRSEIAPQISRKRVPLLTFELIPRIEPES